MFTETVLFSFGIALATVTVIAVLAPMVIQAISNARDGGLHDKLALLSVKAGRSEPLTEDDIADLSARLKMGRYTGSPELRAAIAGVLTKPRVAGPAPEPRLSTPSPNIQALVAEAQRRFGEIGGPEDGTTHIRDDEGNKQFSEHHVLPDAGPQELRTHAEDQYTKVISGSVELILGQGDAESRFEFGAGDYFRIVAGVPHRGRPLEKSHLVDVFL